MNKFIFTIIYLLSFSVLFAQDITTVEAKDQDISDNLDLEAVAFIFGEAKDLEDFEKKLNDPDARISNLDLNQDGYVDYLRVIETAVNNAHLITIQAVLGNDLYQDVATIDVEKDSQNNTRVQVIGDVYLYGDNYIIEPVYSINPLICEWFWSSIWYIWVSPWYYGYYPQYYVVWHPYSYYDYHTHLHSPIIPGYQTMHYVTARRSNACLQMQREIRRNDYEIKQPKTNFAARQPTVINKYELDQQRGVNTAIKLIKIDTPPATGKEVKKDWKTQAEKEGKPSTVKNRKVTVPTTTNISKKETNKPFSTPARKDKPIKEEPEEEEQSPVYEEPERDNSDYERYEPKPTPRKETQEPRNYEPPKQENVNYERNKPSPTPKKTKEVKRVTTPSSKSTRKK